MENSDHELIMTLPRKVLPANNTSAEVLESLTPGQQVVKIVNDELCALLGLQSEKIRLSPNPPTILMMIGLHGSGKTLIHWSPNTLKKSLKTHLWRLVGE